MARFEALKRKITEIQREKCLRASPQFRLFIDQARQTRALAILPESVVMPEKEWEIRIRRMQRLYCKYAARIAAACEKIDSGPIRQYAIQRYLYGCTHEEIADRSFYSLRTVYRQGARAKKELRARLLKEMPQVRRTKTHRYRLSETGLRAIRRRKSRDLAQRKFFHRSPQLRPFRVRLEPKQSAESGRKSIQK